MKIYGVYIQESWEGGGFRSWWTTKSKARTASLELVKEEQKEVERSRELDRGLGGSLNYYDLVESPHQKDQWIGGCNKWTTISIDEIEVKE